MIEGNGLGLSEDISLSLADPVALMQPIGQNLPLELFISYQIIVDRHHGELTCNSSLNKGSQFMIHIPVCATT